MRCASPRCSSRLCPAIISWHPFRETPSPSPRPFGLEGRTCDTYLGLGCGAAVTPTPQWRSQRLRMLPTARQPHLAAVATIAGRREFCGDRNPGTVADPRTAARARNRYVAIHRPTSPCVNTMEVPLGAVARIERHIAARRLTLPRVRRVTKYTRPLCRSVLRYCRIACWPPRRPVQRKSLGFAGERYGAGPASFKKRSVAAV
jgi:hypothetical protein